MALVDPAKVFQGVLVVTVPHMDDEVLACGGTIAMLPHKECIHFIYATDGSKSPQPVLPWRRRTSTDLSLIRMEEARKALGVLGIPKDNIHFLGLRDGRLRNNSKLLSEMLSELISKLTPAHVMVPFRYDRHPDHLALNRATTQVLQRGNCDADVFEYFVYHRWRLLPGGDVRKYINPGHLIEVNIKGESARKRKALECFKSQTTRFYDWQVRPVLMPQSLNEVSQKPEFFLRHDVSLPAATIFTSSATWISLAHRVEPFLKKKKDQAVALWHTGLRTHARKAK